MIPKSLHTVTALVNLAKHLMEYNDDAPIENCVYKAVHILGYTDTPDVHGLIAQALKKLTK